MIELGKPPSRVKMPTNQSMTTKLIPITPDLEFDCVNYEAVSGILMDVINATVAMANPHPWCGYLAYTGNREVVGTCAFKGPPDESGTVELAWFTFPPYEGKGYGSWMAGQLVKIAKEAEGVLSMAAYTLPEKGPSTRICEKCGFTFQSAVDHPEDGTVWLWTRGK